MRTRKLVLNTISSFAFQITTIICGFILPKLLLNAYGSEVNGLVNSITQFLSIIAFLDLGVGAVVQSSLYKPLAEADEKTISTVVKSADKFFGRLAKVLFVYIIVLIGVYPFAVKQDFEFMYTAMLIVAMGVTSFSQYYIGITDRLLLSADQRGYIQYNAQTITLVINTIVCVILILNGFSIQVVKLATSIIYLARPIWLRYYINKNYNINRKIKFTGEPIKQKWNGMAQHIAAIVLDSTDVIILTIFSTLANVSIYSVYHLVVYGVKQLFTVLTGAIQSFWGDMWARQEHSALKDSFLFIEWIIHNGVVFIFGCTGVLLLPFVKVYTQGINDVNYIVPLFAALIVVAHAIHCLRLPYHILIKAVGHYKETQSNYVIAVLLNIIISIATVKLFGLIGVAIGTLLAMLYQTIWMIRYDAKHIIPRDMKSISKLVMVDCFAVIVGSLATFYFDLNEVSFVSWTILAFKTVVVWGIILLVINILVYPQRTKDLINTIKNKM